MMSCSRLYVEPTEEPMMGQARENIFFNLIKQ